MSGCSVCELVDSTGFEAGTALFVSGLMSAWGTTKVSTTMGSFAGGAVIGGVGGCTVLFVRASNVLGTYLESFGRSPPWFDTFWLTGGALTTFGLATCSVCELRSVAEFPSSSSSAATPTKDCQV